MLLELERNVELETSSRIWNRVADYVSYEEYHYAKRGFENLIIILIFLITVANQTMVNTLDRFLIKSLHEIKTNFKCD